MDEIAAAKALQWNMELDVGLRSPNPGTNWEAILKLGLRLQQWSREPPVSAVTASLFDLDPGQEQAFVDAIIMRLIESFRTGNNFTRLCIVKVFKKCSTKRSTKAHHTCFLTKERIPGHVEVLKKVKSVICSGDKTARALALFLIGCLADLGRDSADIHRMVFKALNSPSEQEVHAALYAMGCLCNVSESFSSLALERLIELVNAMETAPKSRIHAIRVFAHMHLSATVTLRVHETGKMIMLSFPSDEVLVATLESLSKLAFKSSVILEEQVNLLLSCIQSDPRTVVRAVSLKCLVKLSKHISWLGSEDKTLKILVDFLDSDYQPLPLQCLALKTLWMLSPLFGAALEAGCLARLWSVVEVAARQPDWSKAKHAVYLLVELSCVVPKIGTTGFDCSSVSADACLEVTYDNPNIDKTFANLDLHAQTALLICDQIALLGCLNLDVHTGKATVGTGEHSISSMKKRCNFFCRCLLKLVQGCCGTRLIIVGRLASMIETFLKNLENEGNLVSDARMADKSSEGTEKLAQKVSVHAKISFILKTVCFCLGRCMPILVSNDPSNVILKRVFQLVMFCTTVHVSHHILEGVLPLLFSVGVFSSPTEANIIATKISCVAKCLLEEGEFWRAYKVSTASAGCGLWTGLPLVISCIAQRAQSEGSHYWLKSISAIFLSEASLQSECEKAAISHAMVDNALDHVESNERTKTDSSADLGGAIGRALPGLHSAANLLAAAVKTDRTFEFQRWMLSLRIKTLSGCGELLSLLRPICQNLKVRVIQEPGSSANDILADNDSSFIRKFMSSVQAVARRCERIASWFRDIAAELDLISVSFIGIDQDSSNMLSCAALGCSLMSFCTTFGFCFTKFGRDNSASSSSSTVDVGYSANDLYQRLAAASEYEWLELLVLLQQLGGVYEPRLIARHDNVICSMQNKLIMLIKWAVKEVLVLQEEAKNSSSEMLWRIMARGTYVLEEMVQQWLCLPWALPKHFFCTRPRVGIQTYINVMDSSEKVNDLNVPKGQIIPLAVCLKICNLDSICSRRIKRVCFVLLLRSAKRLTCVDEEIYTGWKVCWHDSDLRDCNSWLFLVKQLFSRLKDSDLFMLEDFMGDGSGSSTHKFVNGWESFHPIVSCDVNTTGQAFASFMLNTANLRCGQYEIAVQGACLDTEGHCWMLPPVDCTRTLTVK